MGEAIHDGGKSAKPGKKNKTRQDKASRGKAEQDKAKFLKKLAWAKEK